MGETRREKKENSKTQLVICSRRLVEISAHLHAEKTQQELRGPLQTRCQHTTLLSTAARLFMRLAICQTVQSMPLSTQTALISTTNPRLPLMTAGQTLLTPTMALLPATAGKRQQ